MARTIQRIWTNYGNSPTIQEGKAAVAESSLLLAAQHGDLATVQWLLREGGSSIKETASDGSTSLLLAAQYGHLSIMQWLLTEGGSSVAEANSMGSTSLLIAVIQGHLHIVQWLLLEGGSGRGEMTFQGDTALLIAARYGQLRIVQWLLKEGWSSNVEVNSRGFTALLYAAIHGHLAVVQWLLADGGSSVTESSTHGFTALLVAASQGQLTTVQWLLTEGGSKITETSHRGDSALTLAAFGTQTITACIHTVQWLLGQSFTKTELAQVYGTLDWPRNFLFHGSRGEPSDLSQTMLLLGVFLPPIDGIEWLRPWLTHARHLRTALPQWCRVQRTTIIECFVLPVTLMEIITAYSAPSVAEIWSPTLGVYVEHPPRRSDRIRQRLI